MDSKNTLYNRTKDFIYSPKLEDLHVFSKEYLNSILKPYYSSNNENDNYASICIDFNKLNDINNLHSYETGDKIIHYSILLIQSVLPPNCITARIAGDEFLFILNNCAPERIDYYTDKIDNILKENEKELLFCTVTSYGVHSSEKENLSEMIAEADVKITEQKNNFIPSFSHSKWGILEDKLHQNLTSFFKSLRLYKEPITVEFLNSLYSHAISSCSDLLENNFSKVVPNFEEINPDSPFTMDELEKLHSIFIQKDPQNEEINDIDESTFTLLLNNLIYDPSTGALTKGYFQRHLLRDCKHEYEVKYVSTAFVKLYNTIFSHNATDIKINEITDDMINYFKEGQNLTFCREAFLSSPQNYFISLGAGDFLMALPKEQLDKLNTQDIDDYFSSINHDNSDLKDILKLFNSDNFHTMNYENCNNLLIDLSNECKNKKNEHKLSILDNSSVKDALNNIIYDSAEYYANNIPLNNTITSKSRFLNLLAKSMLDISVTLNQEQVLDTQNKEGR